MFWLNSNAFSNSVCCMYVSNKTPKLNEVLLQSVFFLGPCFSFGSPSSFKATSSNYDKEGKSDGEVNVWKLKLVWQHCAEIILMVHKIEHPETCIGHNGRIVRINKCNNGSRPTYR